MRKIFLARLVFVITCCTFLVIGCDSSGELDTGDVENPEATVSPDDVEIVSVTPDEGDATPLFSVVVENQSETTIDGITVRFRLLSGDTVVDSGEAFNGDGLRPGQQGNAEALFFDLGSLDDFTCYEYDVEVIVVDQIVNTSKSYPGTC